MGGGGATAGRTDGAGTALVLVVAVVADDEQAAIRMPSATAATPATRRALVPLRVWAGIDGDGTSVVAAGQVLPRRLPAPGVAQAEGAGRRELRPSGRRRDKVRPEGVPVDLVGTRPTYRLGW